MEHPVAVRVVSYAMYNANRVFAERDHVSAERDHVFADRDRVFADRDQGGAISIVSLK